VFAPGRSVPGSYAAIAAAVLLLSLVSNRLASADVASNLTRAASAVQPLSRTVARAGSVTARASSHLSVLKHQLSLDLPHHTLFGVETPSTDASRFAASFPIRWQKDEPQFMRTARAFRRQGLPLVHLWQSQSGEHMLSLGLNSHGVPGIWLTQKIPD
jgi:hypothetical protein